MSKTVRTGLFDNILERRSCRYFDSKREVSNWDVMLILEAGRWAPSAKNLQPYEFIILRDKRRRKKLAEIARQPQPRKAPVSIVVLGDLEIAGLAGELSPHDTTTKWKGEHVFIYMDVAAAIENMLLVAHSLGLGSLWISSFDGRALRNLLRIPKKFRPLAIIPLGYPARKPTPPPKRRLRDIVHWENFKPSPYDTQLIEFSKQINVESDPR
ncbi:MAG: nitroreductase family protein [Candidatus Altiarchaeota archaeon]